MEVSFYYPGVQIENCWMSWICGTYGGVFVYRIIVGISEIEHFVDIGVDGRV